MLTKMESYKPNSIDWSKYWSTSYIENSCPKKRFLSWGELSTDQRIEAEKLSWARISFSELVVNFPKIRDSNNPLNRQKEIKYTNDGKSINLCFGPVNEPEYWVRIENVSENTFLVTDINGRSLKKPQKEVFSAILGIFEEVNYSGE